MADWVSTVIFLAPFFGYKPPISGALGVMMALGSKVLKNAVKSVEARIRTTSHAIRVLGSKKRTDMHNSWEGPYKAGSVVL